MDRLTQAKLALVVMAAIFFAGSLRTTQQWPNWVAIGLLVVALVLRAVGIRNRRRSDERSDPPGDD